MEVQFPSPEQIYDFSTEQLSKLKAQISLNLQHLQSDCSQKKEEQIERLNDLLETIQMEIQERETIEFFTEMCIKDGTKDKYVKEITDFNNEFKKLAEELINNQQKSIEGAIQQQNSEQISSHNHHHSINKYEEIKPIEQKSMERRMSHTSITSNITTASEDSSTTTSILSSNKRTLGTQQSSELTKDENEDNNDDDQTEGGSKAMKKKANTTIKKMGLGNNSMKKNKNKMSEFIKATLSKTKTTEYVSTKGGIIKPSVTQKSPENKNHSHANSSHLIQQPNSLSRVRGGTPSSVQKQTNSNKNIHKPNFPKTSVQTFTAGGGSSKSMGATNGSASGKSERASMKREDIVQKAKNIKGKSENANGANGTKPKKSTGNKPPKGMDAKSLLDMVKQEEQNKHKKLQQKKQQSQQTQKIVSLEQISLSHTKTNTDGQKIETQNLDSDKNSNKQNITKEVTAVGSSSKLQHKKQYLQDNLESQQQEKPQMQQHQEVVEQQIEENAKYCGQSEDKNEQNDSATGAIKEEINPILSGSDNEDDIDKSTHTQPVKSQYKKGSQSQKILNKRGSKELNAIREEEIEESVVIVNNNAIQAKQFGKITEEEVRNKVNKQNNLSESEAEGEECEGAQQSAQDQEQFSAQEKIKLQIAKKTETEKNVDEQLLESQTKKVADTNSQTKQSNNQAVLLSVKPKRQKKTTKKEVVTNLQQEIKTSSDPNKKCYNQDYWLHIKEQAEAKIMRFKQEKELQEKQKILREQQKVRLKNLQQLQKQKLELQRQIQKEKQLQQLKSAETDRSADIDRQTEHSQRHLQSNQTVVVQEDDNDKFIEDQKAKLKKLHQHQGATKGVNSNNNKKSTSGNTSTTAISPIIRQPKPSYPKPEFNYLQIYPTFNHIFNVFYTKPQSQALLDIPLVMKQLIPMFTQHIQYLKNRKNTFRPAIFLPFDNRNNSHNSKLSQLNDARQLLKHAETTGINLKTMVERLEIFNANIQGEFENCTEEEIKDTRNYRVVKSKEEVYDIITTSFLRRKGWKELPHGQNLKANWNLFWSWSKPEIDMNKLLTIQRVNHFPFNKNLTRKDLLYKNIQYFRKTHKVPFPYLPITFNLPKQFSQFSKKFHQQELINRDRNYWIMKPIGKSRGRGIKVVNSLGDLNYVDNIVVQKYIANPMLIDGYKFDMRIYVLVTSFHPLEAFVYKEGFARLSTQKYSTEPSAMKNNFVHLTNFSINRHNHEAAGKFSGGSKISLKALRQQITNKISHPITNSKYSWSSIWSQIQQIIIKSLLACSISVPPFPAAFQLYGYDVMIDQEGICSLIEVNASPSLQRSFLIDEIIKQSLIDDVINIVDPIKFCKEEMVKVMEERLSQEFVQNRKNFEHQGMVMNGGGGGASDVLKGKKKEKELEKEIQMEKMQKQIQEEDLIHLARVMRYQKIRKCGETPENIGLFEMVAPSPMSRDLQKLIKSKSNINNPHNID